MATATRCHPSCTGQQHRLGKDGTSAVPSHLPMERGLPAPEEPQQPARAEPGARRRHPPHLKSVAVLIATSQLISLEAMDVCVPMQRQSRPDERGADSDLCSTGVRPLPRQTWLQHGSGATMPVARGWKSWRCWCCRNTPRDIGQLGWVWESLGGLILAHRVHPGACQHHVHPVWALVRKGPAQRGTLVALQRGWGMAGGGTG